MSLKNLPQRPPGVKSSLYFSLAAGGLRPPNPPYSGGRRPPHPPLTLPLSYIYIIIAVQQVLIMDEWPKRFKYIYYTSPEICLYKSNTLD